MKKRFKAFAALLLAMVFVLCFAFTACETNTPGGNEGENPGGSQGENPGGNQGENPGGSQGENPGGNPGEEEKSNYVSDDYVRKYGDYDAMKAWLAENIDNMYSPPVTFNINGTSSANLSWTKSEGDWKSIIDFPDESHPTERRVRKINYYCEEEGLNIGLELTLYTDYPALEWNAYLTNASGKTTKKITNLLAFNSVIESNDGVRYLHANRGSTISYTDYEPLSSRLTEEGKHFEVTSGRGSTSTYIPYFNVENKTNNTGTIAIMSWQGQWKADFSETSSGVKLQAGQYETSLKLLENEEMRYPGAVLLFYKGDRMNGQNVYRRWLYDCNLFREEGAHMEKKSAMAMGPYNNFDKDSALLDLYRDTNLTDYLDRFNLDIGWEEGTVVGNWYANSGYPLGLKPLADKIHELGMDFAVWFEPERVQRGTAVDKELSSLPNALIGIDANGRLVQDTDTLPLSTSMLVNYADETALNYMIDLISDYIAEYDIDHYRQDFNIDPQPFWKAQDGKYEADLGIERVGYTENHYCTGYLKMYEELLKRNPDIYIDACASGGQRNDLATVRYSYMHTRSDYWQDIESAQVQTYGSSMWFMYWGTGFSSADLNTYDVRSHIGNSIGVGISDESEAEKLANALKDWSHWTPYLFYDYYPLSDYVASSRKTASLQYDSPEEGKGMIISYFRKKDTISVQPRGLDPNAVYTITNYDDASDVHEMTGAELMTGFEISSKKQTAVVYEYKTSSNTKAFQTENVPIGPGSTDFDPDSVYEEGKVVENVTPPAVSAKYAAKGKTDAELVALYDAAGIDEEYEVVRIAEDYRSTGTIYAISKTMFDELPRGSITLKDGWKAINKNKTGMIVGEYDIPWTSHNDWYWENEIYLKEIDGRYFMWSSCCVGLSDSDGGWTDQTVTMYWTTDSGKRSEVEFTFYCDYTNMQDINLEGADTLDGTGKVYSITEEIFGSFCYTGSGVYMNGMLYYQIDPAKIGIISVFQKTLAEYADPLESLVLFSSIASKNVGAYAATDEDGNYYLWLRGFNEIPWCVDSRMSPVGRSLICWYNADNELCMQTMVHR